MVSLVATGRAVAARATADPRDARVAALGFPGRRGAQQEAAGVALEGRRAGGAARLLLRPGQCGGHVERRRALGPRRAAAGGRGAGGEVL